MTPDAAPIIAYGGIDQAAAADGLIDLKPILKQALARPPRRLSRFIQLAMIGAAHCVGDRALAPDTDICLTSGSGDFDVTFDVLTRVLRDRQAPKPLSFINTVSNAACYYLTKQFDLHGASTFVSRRAFALESAFAQALLNARAFGQTASLVGGVDVLTQPFDTHAERLGVSEQTPLAEGAHWFLIGQAAESDAPLGWLEDVRFFPDAAAASDQLRAENEAGRTHYLYQGFWLAESDADSLRSACGARNYDPLAKPAGFYETANGVVLADFLTRPDMAGARLIHAQADDSGRICLLYLRRD